MCALCTQVYRHDLIMLRKNVFVCICMPLSSTSLPSISLLFLPGAAELVLPGAANQQQRVTRSVSAELQAAATAQQTPKESESSGQDDKRGEEGTDHHRWSEPASGGSNEVPCRNAAGIPADDIKKRPSPGPSQVCPKYLKKLLTLDCSSKSL